MSESDRILDQFKHGKIITFEDKHILEYKDNEDDCNQLNAKIHLNKINLGSEDNRKNDDFRENKSQNKFKFKRTKIKVIKKNLRKETNFELANDEEKNSSSSVNNNDVDNNTELTNFNTNFLTNSNSIFDDTDIFYNRLKIQKKRKTLENTKSEFEFQYNNKLNSTNEENINNSESSIYLSLETEFCRKIDNSSINDQINDSISNNAITKTEIETLYSNSLNKDNLNELQNTILKQENSNDNNGQKSSKNTEVTRVSDEKTQNNLNNNILYEEPLDFGISSTLELLKKRGNISSSNKKDPITSNNNEFGQKNENYSTDSALNSELDFQVSILHTDDNGNILNPKEAFKRLCWKFHGQKVNKNKIEKMLRNHLRNKT
ncbi:SNU66/SART1 family [Cryptosporidium hominis]|uniref:SNU66/SART1 family n=1 Tax=Cryptosporidium hominis TaxID=237895 RepID=A0ABX5B7Y5_CRYHO|nr:SNU66/SART1 family [Cryptosporidium hominis]|eukprot:PPS92644.1 SNU66/SART1 family [Cryptosporidium hominis]